MMFCNNFLQANIKKFYNWIFVLVKNVFFPKVDFMLFCNLWKAPIF